MNIDVASTSRISWQKQIALFLLSQNISLFGSSLVSFAILWHITLETSSGTWMMLITLSAMLPQVLISPWAGVWADRYNRKHLIMLADGFIALATLGLVIAFWAGYGGLLLLLVISVVRSIGAGIQTPAVSAMFPQIVPTDKLTRVQGINQTLNSVLFLLSPAVGGIVLGSLGLTWAFMVDVITAALAMTVLTFLRIEKVVRSEEPAPVFTELRQGVSYVLHHPLLRMILLFYGISFFLITPAAWLSPLLVERIFGADVWRLTLNEVAWTLGTLLGGAFVALKGDFANKIRTTAIGLLGFGVTIALLGVAGHFSIYLIIMGVSGCFMPVVATAQTVLLQENAEQGMMGRVFSLVQIVAGLAMPVAIVFFGPLADVVPIGPILVVTGALLAMTGGAVQIAGRRAGFS